MIKKICFLAGEYPTINSPKSAVFYQNLVHQFARMGIECMVIHPFPINLREETSEESRTEIVDDTYKVKVYRPNSITLGAKKIGRWNTAYLSACFYANSAKELLKSLNWYPDILYGHFISPAGVMAAKLSKETGIPAIISYGESQPWSINTIGIKRTQRLLSSVEGFIAVSSRNKKDLMNLNIAQEEKIKVFPNGVNTKKFYQRDKKKAREKMGWGACEFIVAFVGHFDERKGVLRLNEAVKAIPNVQVAYAGSGTLKPDAPNTIYSGNISPELMPFFLSAADIFVLPTLNEGSCNAVIEAMACGLPIVSSNREFNYDILSNDNALLIDPKSIDDIKSAIINLKNNPDLRTLMGKSSLESVKSLRLEVRARSIVKWMDETYIISREYLS